jgi:hypothetical protein
LIDGLATEMTKDCEDDGLRMDSRFDELKDLIIESKAEKTKEGD